MKRSQRELSQGAQTLATLVRRLTARRVAERVGASGSAVHMWSVGERKPSGAARLALSTAFGIDSQAWEIQPAQKRASDPVAAPDDVDMDPPPGPEARAAIDRVVAEVRNFVASEHERYVPELFHQVMLVLDPGDEDGGHDTWLWPFPDRLDREGIEALRGIVERLDPRGAP